MFTPVHFVLFLSSQTVTPQRMEILRMELAEEIEQPYREKYKKLDEELEKFRNEYNKLRYEYSFLKSEYEHEKEEHQRVLDELKLQNEAEVIKCSSRARPPPP